MTYFESQYDKLITDLETAKPDTFQPESVPRIVAEMKEEVIDLILGFRDPETKKRVRLPQPLLSLSKAREYIARLNEIAHNAKAIASLPPTV